MTSAVGSSPPSSLSQLVRRLAEGLFRFARYNTWALGLLGFLLVVLAFTRYVNPNYDMSSFHSTTTGVLPLALAAVAQAIVVLSGGIDLSISSQMALTSCVAATLMQRYPGDELAVAIVLGVLVLGLALGAVNGALVVVTKVPDIVVTLATYFVWWGFALLVRWDAAGAPGGAAADWLKSLVVGSLFFDWLPEAAFVLLIVATAVWLMLSRTRI